MAQSSGGGCCCCRGLSLTVLIASFVSVYIYFLKKENRKYLILYIYYIYLFRYFVGCIDIFSKGRESKLPLLYRLYYPTAQNPDISRNMSINHLNLSINFSFWVFASLLYFQKVFILTILKILRESELY